MKIEFAKMEEKLLPNFKGGEKNLGMRMFDDGACKIMRCRLEPGASIGLHTHEGNCEIIHVLSGSGVCHDDGQDVALRAGMTHYCPEGHSHGIDNDGAEPLVLLAVLPELR